MSGFAAEWLALREPADRRARDAGVLAAVVGHFAGRDEVTVTDLACGTGATLRALAARLPAAQAWHLVDHDPALLDAIVGRSRPVLPAGRRIALHPRNADLRDGVEAVLARDTDLVTATAFLDLASRDWIDSLAAAAAARRLPVYMALSYDGHTACAPPDPMDAAVLAAFNAHQRRDKGLGGALGPDAAAAAVAAFRAQGFRIREGRSDWQLGAGQATLQKRLVLGWHAAVSEQGGLGRRALDDWLARRLAEIAAGAVRVRVGHQDLWAVPP